jgi:hypothetical protein
MIIMKKALALSILAVSIITLSGCGHKTATETESTVEPAVYFQYGRYYFDADGQGQVVTDDGNVWGYTQDIISEEPSYHNEPIVAVFDDNGTPDDICDDEIMGLVLDRETAIYDALEASLSEEFEIEREGNNIRIGMLKTME